MLRNRLMNVLGLILVASMVLSACGTPATPTEAPTVAPAQPAATEAPAQPAATEAPAATVAPTAAPAGGPRILSYLRPLPTRLQRCSAPGRHN